MLPIIPIEDNFGKFSESSLVRSLYTSKILQSFEVTFTTNEELVPSLSFVEFLRAEVCPEVADVVARTISDCFTSSPSSSDPYSLFLPLLTASAKPALVSSNSSKVGNLYNFQKGDARKFITEFLMKASIRMVTGSKVPQFFLENHTAVAMPSTGMPLDKRIDLIESLVLEVQQLIDALSATFENDNLERVVGSPTRHSPSQ